MAEKYLSEAEIRKLLQCPRCRKVPAGPPIYVCKDGHHECSLCFVKHSPRVDETDVSTDSESDSASTRKGDNSIGVIFPKESKYKSNPRHKCTVCKEEMLTTRNLLAEGLLLLLEGFRNERMFYPGMKPEVSNLNCVECCYNIYVPQYERLEAEAVPAQQVPYGIQQYNHQMDPHLGYEPNASLDYLDSSAFYPGFENGYYNNVRWDLVDQRSRQNFAPQTSALSLAGEPSKRPIRCPTHLCGRNIAVTALSSHFCFDHPEIPPVNVDFDVSSHLFIVPELIPYNYGRCVAVLLIPNKCDSSGSVSHSTLANSPKIKSPSSPLVLMASRLDCITNPQRAILFEEGSRTETLNHGDFHAVESTKTPLLVIWLAGIETAASLFTTIQISEKQTNVRSVIYTGPITSLRSSQKTTKVFEQGDCLVINSGTLENIMGDKRGFDLHVMIH